MPDRQIKGHPGGQASFILPHYKLLQATRARWGDGPPPPGDFLAPPECPVSQKQPKVSCVNNNVPTSTDWG